MYLFFGIRRTVVVHVEEASEACVASLIVVGEQTAHVSQTVLGLGLRAAVRVGREHGALKAVEHGAHESDEAGARHDRGRGAAVLFALDNVCGALVEASAGHGVEARRGARRRMESTLAHVSDVVVVVVGNVLDAVAAVCGAQELHARRVLRAQQVLELARIHVRVVVDAHEPLVLVQVVVVHVLEHEPVLLERTEAGAARVVQIDDGQVFVGRVVSDRARRRREGRRVEGHAAYGGAHVMRPCGVDGARSLAQPLVARHHAYEDERLAARERLVQLRVRVIVGYDSRQYLRRAVGARKRHVVVGHVVHELAERERGVEADEEDEQLVPEKGQQR